MINVEPKVAVEDDLGIIAQELQTAGYEVVNLAEEELPSAQAVVISGEDHNLLARADVKTEAPVINARGKTAEEVESTLQKRIK